jgi:hypothetical protein
MAGPVRAPLRRVRQIQFRRAGFIFSRAHGTSLPTHTAKPLITLS